MPELPEVETIRAQLAPRLEGRVLERVEILDPRLTRPNDLFEVAEELEGDRVAAVERRGKYLVVRLESGLALLVLPIEQYPSIAVSRRQVSVPGRNALWSLSSQSLVPGFRFSTTTGLSAAPAAADTTRVARTNSSIAGSVSRARSSSRRSFRASAATSAK